MRSPARFAALVALLLLAVAPIASATTYEPQITNGTDAAPGAHPFMVGLLHAEIANTYDAQFCGGSIIDPSWVLTAAHCVADLAASDVDVLVGATDLTTGEGTRVDADQVIVHEDYDATTERNDVALVHLGVAQSAAPITRADAGDAGLEVAGTTVRLLGWGGTSPTGAQGDPPDQTYATTLQQADMPVVADATCAADLDGFTAAVMLCAGAPEDDADAGVDACQGDSGGPLFATEGSAPVQIGIVSFGPTCGRSLTAYTRVSAFDSWIETAMGGGTPVDEGLPQDVYRLSGSDRYATAAAFALDRYVRPVPVVYLVTGAAFPDALAVAPLASRKRGVVLLAQRDQLPAVTRDAIAELLPDEVIVVGGQGAISDAVAQQAADIVGTQPKRISGNDRYETAAQVARRVGAGGLPADFPWVFIASGVSFADALGGAAAAASDPSVPLLLTDPSTLPTATIAQLKNLKPERVFVLGGTGAVSQAVVAQIEALGPAVTRLAGANRYETSAKIATSIFTGGSVEVMTATGSNYPDALVAGALGLPLLLLPAPDEVPASVTGAIATLGADVVTIMGGTGAVSDAQGRTLGAART